MYITIYEIDDQSKFHAWNRALKAGTLGQPGGMGWGGSGGKEHVYTYGWLMFMYGRGQYNIVKQSSSNKK